MDILIQKLEQLYKDANTPHPFARITADVEPFEGGALHWRLHVREAKSQIVKLVPTILELLNPKAIEHNWTNWTPTAENINALPEPIRRFIMDLETKCDPAGDVRTFYSQCEQIEGLLKRLREMEAEVTPGKRDRRRRYYKGKV